MAESSAEAARRDKREKMRKSLSSYEEDPLESFRSPPAVRKVSREYDEKSKALEIRLRKVSAANESVGNSPEDIRAYIKTREAAANEAHEHILEGRNIIRETRANMPPGSEKNALKKAHDDFDEEEKILLRERFALAVRRAKLELHATSQPSDRSLIDIYMISIAQTLQVPAGKGYDIHRSSLEQSSFRKLLIKSYTPGSAEYIDDILEKRVEFAANKCWCPVSGMKWDRSVMKASHIVPYAFGEAGLAYILGYKFEEGPGLMWSQRNGLLLHMMVEERLDRGQMVIVPDRMDENEFRSIILDRDLLNGGTAPQLGIPWSTMHDKRLEFKTSARPAKEFLYLHAMLTCWRRRHFNVKGWEYDREQVFTGKIWATPPKFVRKSMMAIFAAEHGDNWEGPEECSRDFPNAKSPEDERKLAIEARYMMSTFWTLGYDEDSESC